MFLLYIPNLSISSQLTFCMLFPSKLLCTMHVLLPSYLPSFTGYKYYNAYLPNVVLLCCSPPCFSPPCVKWKCVKSLGSMMSLGCNGVSAEPWRLARASKFEDAWVLGILKGAVAFKNQDQEHKTPKLESQNILGNSFRQCITTSHFTDSGKLNKP